MRVAPENRHGAKLSTHEYSEKMFYLSLKRQKPLSLIAKKWISNHADLITQREKNNLKIPIKKTIEKKKTTVRKKSLSKMLNGLTSTKKTSNENLRKIMKQLTI
jgi:hypothetical protein